MSARPGRAPRVLEFNALALMTGTVTTAVVGFAFWAAATHFYSAAEVGRASAVISTAALLGNFSHLNLGYVYTRFLPAAGAKTRRLVRFGLGLVATVAFVVGTCFALLWPTDRLFASGTERVLFPVCVCVLTVFAVQDGMLLGLRAATWIPVENVLFSVVKLLLLIALAGVLPTGGLILAWMLPAAAAVAIVVWLMHRTLMPRQMAATGPRPTLPGLRALAGYAAGEYATGAMAFLLPLLLPLLIVARLGAEQNAYFAMPWVISTALNMLIWNVAASFVVEAASDEGNTRTLSRRSLRLAMLVACGGMVALLVGAPLLLRVFGAAYAEQGVDLLRLVALAAPATVVTTMYTSVARVRRQVGRVVAVEAALGLTVLALTLLLIEHLGITGVGVAYLAAEGVVGAVLLGPLLRALRTPPAESVTTPVPHPHRERQEASWPSGSRPA